jgi:hypothetical protein
VIVTRVITVYSKKYNTEDIILRERGKEYLFVEIERKEEKREQNRFVKQ